MKLTIKQAAEVYGLKQNTIYQQHHRGEGIGSLFKLCEDGILRADPKQIESMMQPAQPPKLEKISFRVNAREREAITALAGDQPVAEYCRDRALKK